MTFDQFDGDPRLILTPNGATIDYGTKINHSLSPADENDARIIAGTLYERNTFDDTPAITYPDLPAVADPGTAGYTAVGGTWSGGTYTRTASGVDWVNGLLRSVSPLGLGARASGVFVSGVSVIGLHSSNLDAPGQQPDFGIYLRGNGYLGVFAGDTAYLDLVTYTVGDLVEVYQDGVVVHFSKNGTDFKTLPFGLLRPMYFYLSANAVGSSISNISFSIIGTTYVPNWTLGIDGWNNWVGSGVVSAVNNNLRSAQGDQAFTAARKGISVASGRMIQLMVRGSVAGAQAVWLQYYNGSTYVTIDTVSAITTDWQSLVAILPASTSFILIRTSSSLPAGEYFEIYKDLYIGDGSYTWTLGDASGNGNGLVPHGGLTQVTGVSGKAIQFDGTTGYLSGLLSGFTDKITVSFWENFSAFNTTQKVLWSSFAVSSLAGQIELRLNADGVAGRIRLAVKTVTGSLEGYYLLPSAGWHNVAFEYEKTITSNSALLLFVDGAQVAMTYDLPYSGAGTLPSIYNGPFFVHSRGGALLFADGWIDELRIDKRKLSPSQIQLVYSGQDLTNFGIVVIPGGGQPVLDRGIENQALISLLTEEGWCGNIFLADAQKIGSDYVKTCRTGGITLSRLAVIEDSARRALTSNTIPAVTCKVTNPKSDRIALLADIGMGQTLDLQKHGLNWIAQAGDPAGRRTTL